MRGGRRRGSGQRRHVVTRRNPDAGLLDRAPAAGEVTAPHAEPAALAAEEAARRCQGRGATRGGIAAAELERCDHEPHLPFVPPARRNGAVECGRAGTSSARRGAARRRRAAHEAGAHVAGRRGGSRSTCRPGTGLGRPAAYPGVPGDRAHPRPTIGYNRLLNPRTRTRIRRPMTGDPKPRPGVALVIGVGDYRHHGMVPLRFAVADAEALADLLTDPDVCAFPADRVALLTDAAAHRDAIVYHLSEWLPRHARGAELVVIYFAGHGTARALGRKEAGFLLPHDADPDNPVARGVAMGDLARWIEGLEATAVVVCIDCCHAGMALTRGPEPVGPDLALSPRVLDEVAGRGQFWLASCDEGQRSVEDPALGHGLFTYHLLKGITGEGDRDGDGRVGVAELFEYVSQAVVRDARKYGVQQKPWTKAHAAGGVYISAPRARRHGPAPPDDGARPDDGPEAAVAKIKALMPAAGEP